MIRSKRRGSAFLVFLVVAWPLLMFGGALGVDLVRIITVTRQMEDAAISASLAGTTQYQCGSPQPCTFYRPWLNRVNAQQAVTDYMTTLKANQQSTAKGTLPRNFTYSTTLPAGSQPRSVTVRANFTIDDLIFASYLQVFTGGQPIVINGTVEGESFVCLGTDLNNSTQGNCTRPPAS